MWSQQSSWFILRLFHVLELNTNVLSFTLEKFNKNHLRDKLPFFFGFVSWFLVNQMEGKFTKSRASVSTSMPHWGEACCLEELCDRAWLTFWELQLLGQNWWMNTPIPDSSRFHYKLGITGINVDILSKEKFPFAVRGWAGTRQTVGMDFGLRMNFWRTPDL